MLIKKNEYKENLKCRIKLKEEKTRKSIVGYFCLFAGLWSATISFEKVELFLEYNKAEIIYKF